MNFKTESNFLNVKNSGSYQLVIFDSTGLKSVLKNFSLTALEAEEISRPKAKIFKENKVIYFLNIPSPKDSLGHAKSLDELTYSTAREFIGARISEIASEVKTSTTLEFFTEDKGTVMGSLVGIELGLYRFKKSLTLRVGEFKQNGKKLSSNLLLEASDIGVAINQARHLVNLPPNELNPVSYANELKKMFSKSKTLKVDILDEKKLAQEKCGLLLAVGNSAKYAPRIVHISYKGAAKTAKSIALVGKGLTFDSGGLDIKPAAGMRLMKKDMGGSATLVGVLRWLENSGAKKNIDIYLALAENAISAESARPGDIYTSRAGFTVEMHNTDAEGRLALADAISIALDKNPEILIDVATLTGAGKVSLGQDIASLFSNDDKLANTLQECSSLMGDFAWRMPLYRPYETDFKSDYADFTNAGTSGFAGSITAALFLENFIPKKVKWAHLDIFAWTSGAKPSLIQKGGSGQSVETLIAYLK